LSQLYRGLMHRLPARGRTLFSERLKELCWTSESCDRALPIFGSLPGQRRPHHRVPRKLIPPVADCRSYLITGESRTGKEASVSIAREGLENSQGAHSSAPAGSHFFAGGTHAEALARLEHLVENGSHCGIVTGPRGTGKSTVLHVFAQGCRAAGLETVSIDVTGLAGQQFLERLAQRLQVTSRARGRVVRLWTEIVDALAGRALASRNCVLVLDHLDRALGDCQRLVQRLVARADTERFETWVLAFSGRLFPMVPRQWRERTDLRIELGPLNKAESHAFLRSLGESFGRPADAFEATADALVRAAGGVASDLRRMGELSLLLAADPDNRVSTETLDAVLEELRGLRYSA
jgi:type II secretory pathway predicted ATPase ExeA